MAAPSRVRRGVNGFAHLLEGAAPADIGDGVVDVGVGRLRIVLEQGRDRHDHAALAIAALRNVVIDPGLLNLVQDAVDGETLNGGDLLADGFTDRYSAGAHRNAVDMDRARAALCNTATVFGAGQADIFPDCPKKWRIVFDVNVDCFAVDSEVCHRVPLISSIHRLKFRNVFGLKTGTVQIKILRLTRSCAVATDGLTDTSRV